MIKLSYIFRYIIILAFCTPIFSFSQGFELAKGHEFQKVKFQLINNLIVIPVNVNGSQLSFLLDSGVTSPILFNLSGQDSVQINDVREVAIKGLGEGEPIMGLSSKGNTFKIGQIKNTNQNLFVVLDKDINYSPSLGIPVHGIIGYDLFRDFVVDINYSNQVIKFYDPKYYKPKLSKKYEELPLDIDNRRAYVSGNVFYRNKEEIPVRLLIDTGSSDAIWLFEDGLKGLDIPEKYYDDYLGKGLNGNIFGKRTMVEGFRLGNNSLQGPKVAFPKMENFNSLKDIGDRNGSVGGEILKRFNVVFNYSKNEIILKRNRNFKTPFQYNMSGIELMHAGMRLVTDNLSNPGGGVVKDNGDSYGNVQILLDGTTRLSLVPEIIVSSIRMGSPADDVGLREGDLILSVNGKSVHRYKLQEVLGMINERVGKRVKLVVERSNKDMKFSFVLKKIFE